MNYILKRALLLLSPALLPALSATAAPRIQLDPDVLRLGHVKQNEIAEREVLVHNLGDEVLEIEELSTTCPCTFPEIENDRIEPGETGRIHVTFQSKTYQGDVRKLIEVYSNDPERSYVEIGVEVFVEAPVYVDPDDRKLDFGTVKNGASPTLTVGFHEGDGNSLEVSLLDYNEALLDCKSVATAGGDPSDARLSVGLHGDAPAGPFREIIRVGTSAPGAAEIDLEVFGRIEAELMAEPDRINFRMVPPGSELDRELKVSSAGAPFTVTGAEIDLPGLNVEILEAGPGRDARLRIYGHAMGRDDEAAAKSRGRMKGTLRIHTDHPTQPELEVIVLYMMRM